MSTRSRLEKLERESPTPPQPAAEPSTVIWLPVKNDGSSPPAGTDVLSPDGRVLMRYYSAPSAFPQADEPYIRPKA